MNVLFVALSVISLWSWNYPRISGPDFASFNTMQGKWTWSWPGPEGGTPIKIVADPANIDHAIAQTDISLWNYSMGTWNLDLGMQNIPTDIVAFGNDQFGLFALSMYKQTPQTAVFYKKTWGGTWEEQRTFYNFMAVGEATGPVNYVVTADTLFKTTDSGDSWTPVHTGELFDVNFATNIDIDFSPLYPDTVYLAVYSSTPSPMTVLLRSTDGGVSWDTTYVDGDTTQGYVPTMKEIEVKPDDPNFVVIVGGLYRGPSMVKYSSDGGYTFNVWLETLMQGVVTANDVEFVGDTVYISNALPNKLVRGVKSFGIWMFTAIDTVRMYDDIFMTSNGGYGAYSAGAVRINGENVVDVSDGIKAVEIIGHLFEPSMAFFYSQHGPMDNGTIALGDIPFYLTRSEEGVLKPNNVIYISHDGGNSWAKKYLNSAIVFSAMNAPTNPDYIYVGAIGLDLIPPDSVVLHTLYRSTDGGNTFVPMQSISDTGEVNPIMVEWISPSNPDVIIATSAGERSYCLLRSTDGGASFTTISTLNDEPVALTGTDTLFFIHGDPTSGLQTIEVSYNSGVTWSTFTTMMGTVTFDAVYDPVYRNLSVLCLSQSGLEIRRYMLDGSYETLPSPQSQATPLNISVDGHGHIFMGLMRFPDALIARFDGSVWEIDSTFPALLSEILATDTSVIGFTLGFSTFMSSDAAFGIQEPSVPPVITPSPVVLYDGDRVVLQFHIPTPTQIKLRLFDVTGREIYSSNPLNVQGGTVTMPLPAYVKNGIYIYELASGNETFRGKLLIVR